MRALVTGCAGFIGSHLAESLLADGYEVVGVDCFNDNYGREVKRRSLERAMEWGEFDFVPVDLARGDVVDLVAEADVVFHLAAEPGVRTSWGGRFEAYTRNNILATQHLLEAMRLAGTSCPFVYASSSSVYGQAEVLPIAEDAPLRPYSPYGVTKLAAEHLCGLYHANHGVRSMSLRYFTVYGPRQRPDMAFNRFCRAALGGEPARLFGDGEQTRDFTYVDDIVEGTRAAARAPRPGRVYNLGGGHRVSMNAVLRLLEDLTGRRLRVERTPPRPGDLRHTAADIGRARAELSFEPSTALAAGLQAQLEWMGATQRV